MCAIGASNVIIYTATEKLDIKASAFNDSITSHTFANGIGTIIFSCTITNIGEYAFNGCSNLMSITIPNSITSIGMAAFENCISLTSITIPDSVTSIGWSTFKGCTSLTSVTIPNSVTSIGGAAFEDCTSLTSIIIPDSVTSIGERTFLNCTSLTSITIPNSVTIIWDGAFNGCTGLTSVTIPNGVTSIRIGAFSGCTGLTSIRSISAVPPSRDDGEFTGWGGDATFNGVDHSIPVYVPTKESISLYQAAIGWRAFTNYHTILKYSSQNSLGGDVSTEYSGIDDTYYMNAIAAYGYHFTKWSDGNTDNPRSVVLTRDSALTFVAEFAPNAYTIKTISADPIMGKTYGDTTVLYQSFVEIGATTNYGYRFDQWSDGNTDNPRWVIVSDNTTYTALFAKKTYHIIKITEHNQGVIYGEDEAYYLDAITLTPEPYVGYHFTQWSDGNTDNPRTIVLTQDTMFTAKFAQSFSGQCGDHLYWTYANNTLNISGDGAMYDYDEDNMPWLLFRNTTTAVILERGITHIGNNAFYSFAQLNKLELPNTLTSIGESAFAGCLKLYDIYSYAIEPPAADNSSFANYNVHLYAPCDNLMSYQMNAIFGSFKYFECISAENTTTDDNVIVTPTDKDATIVWTAEKNAGTYSITITKDGVVFCTLTFNVNGQLMNIAFAPGRNGNHTPAATLTTNGYRFTVTGLTECTRYAYDFDIKNTSNKVIKNYSGEFTTTTKTAIDNVATNPAAKKIIHNGVIYILRSNKLYTTHGQLITIE